METKKFKAYRQILVLIFLRSKKCKDQIDFLSATLSLRVLVAKNFKVFI